jgi:hypothetical protein
MKLNKIDLIRLRNEEHYELMLQLDEEIRTQTPQRLKLEKLYPVFQSLLERENAVLEQIRKSDLTESIADLDAKRDDLFRGLHSLIDSFGKHYDLQKSDAAKKLLIIFNEYGNVPKETYPQETAAITNLIEDLRTKYPIQIKTLVIGDYINVLEQANNDFRTTYTRRNATMGEAQLDENMRQVRKEMDVVYRRIVERIDACIVVNGEADFVLFVKHWNETINKFNNMLAIRKGKNATAKDEVNKG